MPIAGPCSAQAACSGADAGWPRPSRRSSASSVVSRKRMPCGSACERSAVAGSRMPSAVVPAGPKRPRATPRAKLRWSVAGSGSSCSAYSGSGAPSGRSTAAWAQSWAWRQGEGPGRRNSTEGSRWDSWMAKDCFDDIEDRSMRPSISKTGSRSDVGNLESACPGSERSASSVPQPSSSGRARRRCCWKGSRSHVVERHREGGVPVRRRWPQSMSIRDPKPEEQ